MSDVCMVFSEDGNAYDCFDYEPASLRDAALRLEMGRGEVSIVTVGPSPFVVDVSSSSLPRLAS